MHSVILFNQINMKIMYFPAFGNKEDLNDHIARASWYLGCLDAEKIVFPIAADMEEDFSFRVPEYLDENVSQSFNRSKNKIQLINVDNQKEFLRNFDHSEIIMQWKLDDYYSDSWKKKFEDARSNKNRQVWRVDRFKERFEGSFYIKVGLEKENYPGKEKDIKENQKKFIKMTEKIGPVEKAYLFGTGPMVTEYKAFDYSDGLSIICNSIIFDDEMLEYVKPKILAFGDPIFHFGISQYASTFRKKLTGVLQKNKMYLIIPFNYYRLFAYHFPQYNNITIAIPFEYDRPINLNLIDNFYLYPSSNVLTNLMLPIACTFANEINLLGSDGRKKIDDSYFWKHNSRTQINDKMENIKEAHPSFFNIDYNEYYDGHIRILGEYLDALEKSNKTYKTLTPSYVPVLRKRYEYRHKPYEKDFYPLVSIIMPCYKDTATIKTAVESVVNQEYENWELIVVNEDEAPELKEIIDNLKAIDTRIRVFHKKHEGVSFARNMGIKNAKGEYIAFLDADDIYFPGSLKLRMESLITNGYEAVFCVIKMLDESLKELKWEVRGRPNYFTFMDMFIPPIISVIVLKSRLEQSGLFDETMTHGEDWDLLQRLGRIGVIFWSVAGASVGYRQKPNSAVLGNYEKHYNGLKRVLDIIYSEDKRVNNPVEEYRYGIGCANKLLHQNKRLFQLFIWMIISGNLRKAEEISKHLSPIIFLNIKELELIDLIQYTVMRYYRCNFNEWEKYFLKYKEDFINIFPNNLLKLTFNTSDLLKKIDSNKKKEIPGNKGDMDMLAMKESDIKNWNLLLKDLKKRVENRDNIIKNMEQAIKDLKQRVSNRDNMIKNRDQAIKDLKEKLAKKNKIYGLKEWLKKKEKIRKMYHFLKN